MDQVTRYRQYAANCLRAAQELPDQPIRKSLIDMARVWMALARQADENPPSGLLQPPQPNNE
jgi:hypothetical protein